MSLSARLFSAARPLGVGLLALLILSGYAAMMAGTHPGEGLRLLVHLAAAHGHGHTHAEAHDAEHSHAHAEAHATPAPDAPHRHGDRTHTHTSEPSPSPTALPVLLDEHFTTPGHALAFPPPMHDHTFAGVHVPALQPHLPTEVPPPRRRA